MFAKKCFARLAANLGGPQRRFYVDNNRAANLMRSAINKTLNIETEKDIGLFNAPLESELQNVTSAHIIHVHAGPGNTIVTLTDALGRVLVSCSGGTAGFKKAQRGGPESAFQAVQQLVLKTKDKNFQVKMLEIRLKGFGSGREAAYKAIRALTDWQITRLTDATPIAFGGCRPKKARRL